MPLNYPTTINIKKLKPTLAKLSLLLSLFLYCLLLNAKDYKDEYAIHISDFYIPVLSETENSTFFENLMDNIKVYAIYCTQKNAPKSALRKVKLYNPKQHDIDSKDHFKIKTKHIYRENCKAIETIPKNITKNSVQLNSIKQYRFYNLIGFELKILPSLTSQYNLTDSIYNDPVLFNGGQEGSYKEVVTTPERFFLPLKKINTITKATYIQNIVKYWRGEGLLKSVGLGRTPISIIALVTNDKNTPLLDSNEKFTTHEKLVLSDKIEPDYDITAVDLKNSFTIHQLSEVKASYAKTPNARVLYIFGRIDKNAQTQVITPAMVVKIEEIWHSYMGDVISIRGKLESRIQFNCQVAYQLNFYPDGTSNKSFEVYTDDDVLKSYEGTAENINNMKNIIQQYKYDHSQDPLNECGRAIEYVKFIFLSSPQELSKNMQEMGEITFTKNSEQRKEQYLELEKHSD